MALSNFGNFILKAREKKSKSQKELASELEWEAPFLSKMEKGSVANPSPEQLKNIFSYLEQDFFVGVMELVKDKYKTLWGDREKALFELVIAAAQHGGIHEIIAQITDEDIKSKILVSSIQAQKAEILRNTLIEPSGLAEWEQNLPGPNNFWIITSSFIESEFEHFLKVVLNQLKMGSRYTYFLLGKQVNSRFEYTFNTLDSEIQKNIKAISIDETTMTSWVGKDSLIFANPTDFEKFKAFRCVGGIDDRDYLNFQKIKFDDSRKVYDLKDEILLYLKENNFKSDLINHITKSCKEAFK